MLPKVAGEVLEQTCRTSRISIISNISPSKKSTIINYSNGNDQLLRSNGSMKNINELISTIHHINANNQRDEQIWQLWRWKPPVQSLLQSRDDYFHNPASTPHTIMHEFKKHLSPSKDLKFRTCDLRFVKNVNN
ncbi:eukaryotic translation initiation factor 4E family-like protein [Euroglyphus maynei]|uniref:Eukaryotic translation initiation factor 4E family-like protein n=1 Tax=Euroglyphus maynei TaxID=6958 RepID=A0A1Y3AKU6_EURMA|nr:eukaryotic translation initiation factor 4E family-like protein [Euroglyphus maynei]